MAVFDSQACVSTLRLSLHALPSFPGPWNGMTSYALAISYRASFGVGVGVEGEREMW